METHHIFSVSWVTKNVVHSYFAKIGPKHSEYPPQRDIA